MYVKTLDLRNYRNYESLSLKLSSGTNIFYGSNAQGKTNVLEAVFLAGTTKSHRTSKDKELIRIGEEESHIRMEIDRNDNEYRIDVHLKKNRGKGYAVGGIPLKKAADLFSIVSMVFFSPEDLNMVKNGPQGRRRFLDFMLCGIDRIYLSDLTAYSKCLSQRNALLKVAAFDARRIGELDIWDAQIVEYGTRIIERRRRFLEKFRPIAAEKHMSLTGGKEELSLLYEPNVSKDLLAEKMAANRNTDLHTKTTNAGPHRDDLSILIGGMDLRIYGSQGQQRTAALSVKLAEIETIRIEKHEMPVLLLDDVLSELDSDRQCALLDSIQNTQTLITCTGLDANALKKFRADKVFYVTEGTVVECSE